MGLSRQNCAAGLEATQMKYLFTHVYIIFYIGMYILIYGWPKKTTFNLIDCIIQQIGFGVMKYEFG